MSFTLRPYQNKFVKNLSRAILLEQAVIACAPTGSGKSKIMATIATKAVATGKKAVLIVTESIKIYEQLAAELPIVNINAGVKTVHIARGKVYLAMAQTLARRPLLLEELKALGTDLIVLNDEAHIGTSTKLLKQLVDDCYLLGFTATPHYAAAKHLPVLYKKCIQACQVDELIQEGFLCTYRHIARDKADLSILELRDGKYTEESQEKAFGSSDVYDGILEDLAKFPFKKAMLYCASIKHAEEVYQMLIENGHRACRYHSGNKLYPLPNPEYELAKFTELDMCNICISVMSLTKGFDYPAIDLIALLSKTVSLPAYLQKVGRASRPIPGVKDSFFLLDYGSHWKTLGLYWDDRDWETLWLPPPAKKKKQDGGGVATVKACPNCDELIAVQARICPACKYEFPEIKQVLEIGEAVEVTECYTALIGKSTSELNATELAVYAKIKNKKAHAIRIAMSKEHDEPGFIKKFGEEMGLKRDWIYMTTRDALTAPKKDFHDIELK